MGTFMHIVFVGEYLIGHTVIVFAINICGFRSNCEI